jgi:hypothetical protein
MASHAGGVGRLVKALPRALVVIGAIGAGLGAVPHVAALLGNDLAWMAPVPS